MAIGKLPSHQKIKSIIVNEAKKNNKPKLATILSFLPTEESNDEMK
jgi:hypothetical protein